ncbi:MAG: cytochrome c [Bacteroidota bacterium]
MKKTVLLSILMTLLACSQAEKPIVVADEAIAATDLPEANAVDMIIEPGPGSEDFIANCQTCHTARYALMQPKLSKKAWQKSVDKMIHVYGAEIDSATASRIVDYLVVRQ